MKYEKIGQSDIEHNAPALRVSLPDIVEQYLKQHNEIPTRVEEYEKLFQNIKSLVSVGGAYGGSIETYNRALSIKDLQMTLLKSAWLHVYKGLQVEEIASVADRKRFDQKFTDPEEFTLENIKDAFADYLLDPRYQILKGLAECFCDLDPAFKSHDKVKIGVSGLPKRIIVTGCGSYSSYGKNKIKDVLDALNVFLERPKLGYAEFHRIWQSCERFEEPIYYGCRLRLYLNGNCHIHFEPETLKDINRALAEFYGEVLADSPEERAKQKRRASTDIAKDLAYFPTPMSVVEKMIDDAHIDDGTKVLDPSCGCGRILRGIRQKLPNAKPLGIEVDAKRANEARSHGFNVLQANFLETQPDPVFHYVVMNPPFAGKHYQKHVEHAKKFLKPGGKLVSILPATAHYDHGYCGDPAKRWNACWKDLPIASFKDSGTNINTGIYTWYAPKEVV